MKRQNPQPRNEEITQDTIFQRENLIYITFYVNGSHQVEVNGIKRMPGQDWREEFASNMPFDAAYSIRFLDDWGVPTTTNDVTNYDILGDPNLKHGKFVWVRFATGVETDKDIRCPCRFH